MSADVPKKRPRNVLPDLIIPILALAFAGYYLTTITEVPWIAQASAVTVSALLLTSILAFLGRTGYRIARGRETVALSLPSAASLVTVRRIALLVLTIAYVLVIGQFGFTLATTAFIFLGIVVLSSPRNWRAAALVAVGCALAGYVVFIYFFETRFPRGPVENLLKGLLQQ